MSESSYGAQAGAGAAAGPDAARQRQMLVIAIAAAVVVALVLGYFMFMRGGSANTAAPVQRGQSQSNGGTTAPASVSPSASPAQPGAIPAVYSAPPNHNPFKPVVTTPPPVPPSSSSSASPSASLSATSRPSTSPTTSPTVVVTPTATASSSASPTATVTATPSPTGLPTAGAAISLTLDKVDLSAVTADVTVTDGGTSTQYTNIRPGQIFGKYFKLVSILSSDPANPPVIGGADFQYGDQFIQLSQGDSAQLG